MKLTREERSRILAGDATALKRKKKPDIKEGDTLVLVWSRARTVVTDRSTGETAQYPRQPLLWIELAEPIRHRDGGWRIGMKVHDERTKTRFLGPSSAPSEESLNEETERGYRSTASGAIDPLEAVDDEELKRQDVKSRENWTRHIEQMAAEEQSRRQERAVRELIREAVRELGPMASQPLLAAIEREIRSRLEEDH